MPRKTYDWDKLGGPTLDWVKTAAGEQYFVELVQYLGDINLGKILRSNASWALPLMSLIKEGYMSGQSSQDTADEVLDFVRERLQEDEDLGFETMDTAMKKYYRRIEFKEDLDKVLKRKSARHDAYVKRKEAKEEGFREDEDWMPSFEGLRQHPEGRKRYLHSQKSEEARKAALARSKKLREGDKS